MNKKHLFSLLSISCVFSLGSATAAPAAYRHYTFDTVSDNATPDASSHQAHALLSGQELCEGVIGQALQFKAGSKGLALGDLGLQAPATLSFWMKTNGPQSDGRLLSQLEGAATQCGALRLADGSLTVWNAQEWSVVVNGLISTGIWQHVAVVLDRKSVV